MKEQRKNKLNQTQRSTGTRDETFLGCREVSKPVVDVVVVELLVLRGGAGPAESRSGMENRSRPG